MHRDPARASSADPGRVDRPDVAFYGDDFTGSVDVLLQFARRGWSARLFVGRPSAASLAAAAAETDVIGIAGIARSLPTASIEQEVGPALDLLLSLRPRILQYKACSTADSSPDVGSLGRVLEVARERVPGAAPILFAQPDFGRYTAFGHHFAAERGTVYRLDRQPTMSRHPSTPMRESDLAQHLRAQTSLEISNIPFTEYDRGPEPRRTATAGRNSDAHRHTAAAGDHADSGRLHGRACALADRLRDTDAAGVVLDALDESHLHAIGVALGDLSAARTRAGSTRPVFAIGSGGLSHAIAIAEPRGVNALPERGRETGPVLAVSGSRSPQTRRQADAARAAGWLVRPLALDGGPLDDVSGALRAGRSVVLTSDDADVSGVADALPRIAAAATAAIRAALPHTRRLIVAGGDTSSRVTALLGISSLSLAANPSDNVVLLTAHAADPAVDGAELLLKGGQVGSDELFEEIRAPGGA